MSRRKKHRLMKGLLLLAVSAGFFGAGTLMLWVAAWKLPDLSAFRERKVSESTKIYDRTGEIVLYDLHGGAKRTVVPYAEMSRHIKNATVAIEDARFFSHRGIEPKAILRATFANVTAGGFSQGGSTITQQVVKNSLLTSEKKISRKLKEWVLALKLEQTLSKEEILALYLNEVPYGGQVYGIEEAAQSFFGKHARELGLAESAYLAALPNAPTYYSPYGNHRDELEERKTLVLTRMRDDGFITPLEFEQASGEKVAWQPQSDTGILAPHFVMFVRQYLEEKYGRSALEAEGLRVMTTLDYELQKLGEGIVKKYALHNKEQFDAENAALIAIDPKTGQILAMVGSRDYFDKEIDGNFNATIAYRQPGSAFKPFVYAQAFRKGYLPETVVFDVSTEFSAVCNPDGTPIAEGDEERCYRPVNYDGKYHGPISFRGALAQSVNIPAIKVLYLAGLKESLRLAKDMGITTLAGPERYGLTLVLGGGEVKLLELASAYGVFAAEGVKRTPNSILRIERKDGTVLEEWQDRPEQVLPEEIARTITDILSDNDARTPAFGAASPLYFPGRAVAAKTGTTNDYRDAWVVGYAPNLAVGAWAGNNDNRPMQKKVAAFIVAPLWHEFIQEALQRVPPESFTAPRVEDYSSLPPIVRGLWQGNKTFFLDKLSGKRATEWTPPELLEERAVRELHSILYWIDKDNPRVPRATPPETDPQFSLWEYGVRAWAGEQSYSDETESIIPDEQDDLHNPAFAPQVTLLEPGANAAFPNNGTLIVRVNAVSKFPLAKINIFINNSFVGSLSRPPWELRIPLADSAAESGAYELRAVAHDIVENRGEASVTFTVTE